MKKKLNFYLFTDQRLNNKARTHYFTWNQRSSSSKEQLNKLRADYNPVQLGFEKNYGKSVVSSVCITTDFVLVEWPPCVVLSIIMLILNVWTIKNALIIEKRPDFPVCQDISVQGTERIPSKDCMVLLMLFLK